VGRIQSYSIIQYTKLLMAFFAVFQTCSEAHPAFCPMGTGGFFPASKMQGNEADKIARAIPPLPHTSSWRAALFNKKRDKFIFKSWEMLTNILT
jgi:hypothetical protein